jgi:hypothetical protein
METKTNENYMFRRWLRKLSVIRLEGEAIAGSFNGTQGSRELKRRNLYANGYRIDRLDGSR